MFVAIYRWRVATEKEPAFRAAWAAMTALIAEQCGSLGSRLHRADDGTLVAYAQWPSREAWETKTATGPEAEALRDIMRSSSERILPDVLLDVLDDRLVHQR